MIYEFRTYEAAPGKLEALVKRTGALTWPIMTRLGFQQVGFWVPEGGNELVYVLRWADRAAAEAGWKAFQSDEEWKQGKAASETDGPLLAKGTSAFWNPTDYSQVR